MLSDKLKSSFQVFTAQYPKHTIIALDESGSILAAQWNVPDTHVSEVLGTKLVDHIPLEYHKVLLQNLPGPPGRKINQQPWKLPLLSGDGYVTWWTMQVIDQISASAHSTTILLGELRDGCSEDENSMPLSADEILQYLVTALLDHEVIEVEMDSSTDRFACFLLPFPPDDWRPPNGVTTPYFKPGEYLLYRQRIFVCPLEPSTGNLFLRRAKQITLRFHYNLVAMETSVTLHQVWKFQSSHAIELSYPRSLRRVKMRSVRRVNIPPGMSLRLNIQSGQHGSYETRVLDLSPYGLSFYLPPDACTLEIEERVSMTIHVADGDPMTLQGTICSLRKTRDDADTSITRAQIGVEFSPIDDYEETLRLRKIVSNIRKRSQHLLAQKRQKFEPDR